jgi:hypothetical protein
MSELSLYSAQRGGPGEGKHARYFNIYDRYFSEWKGKSPKILEIGLGSGSSLELWRQYFGAEAEIIGIDINGKEGFDGWFRVFIGDQGDREFLKRVVKETGGEFDIVIDDGSHRQDHIIASFETLYPHVTKHGIYLVEDLHTAYWSPPLGGTPTFMDYTKAALDELNACIRCMSLNTNPVEGNPDAVTIVWDASKVSNFARHTMAIHVYDSVVVFEKGRPAILNWQFAQRASLCQAGHRLGTGFDCIICGKK